MPDSSQLVRFLTGAFIIIVIPGPSIFYLVARSIHQGRTAGFASVLGIEATTFVHVCAAGAHHCTVGADDKRPHDEQ